MLDQMMILAADQSTKSYQMLDAISERIYAPLTRNQRRARDGRRG